MAFINLYKHLLPRAKAWTIIVDKTLRKFFEGLSVWPQDYRDFIDQVWLDIFPSTTNQLTEWENQFNVQPSTTDDAARRANLEAAWKSQGVQSPGGIEAVLQSAGFDVYVHEWWETPVVTDPPVKRNPNVYISGGIPVYLTEAGEPLAEAGEPTMEAGETADPPGYLLVNKGPDTAYSISAVPDDWVYFMYVGGETFPALASVQGSRKDELDRLVLKLKPAHTWAGMLINFT